MHKCPQNLESIRHFSQKTITESLLIDEREKYDPTGFRDAVLLGLEKAGNDLEAISKYLDAAGSKLDYRRYGEVLFDILIAGGLLVPGGSIAQDGDKPVKTSACVFEQPEDMDSMRNFEQVNIGENSSCLLFATVHFSCFA